MYKVFMDLEFDYDKAEKWIESHDFKAEEKVAKKKKKKTKNGKERKMTIDKKTTYLMAISNLKDKRFRYFRRNKTNKRLDTNLTNLKSSFRPFMVGDYQSIDLKNSQPFLFSQMINQLFIESGDTLCWFFENHKPIENFGARAIKKILELHQNDKNTLIGELKSFTDSVTKGTLYDDFMKTFGDKVTRDDVKDIILKVFFSRNITEKGVKPYLKDKAKFISVFPLIYRIIFRLKYKLHRDLSVYLQNLESYIFIDCIAKELVEAGIIPLTIHDSIIIESRDKDKAMEIVYKVFMENFGVIPTFHVNPLRKEIEVVEQDGIKLALCA